jgi:hypothetical protein
MEGKLIKTTSNYFVLNDECGNLILENISLKNCQDIESGYDLDELVNKLDTPEGYDQYQYDSGIRKGFELALELLGDKKFSEDDVLNLIKRSREKKPYNFDGKSTEYKFSEDELIHSLQVKEWNVEIVTKPYTEVGEGFELESKREPKLDADGCLILIKK